MVACLGQLMFVLYLVVFYGGAVVNGNPEAWNKVLPNGYTPGAPLANLTIGLHLLVAIIMTLGGPLQLIPQVRARFPTFHRWNGRVYMVTAVVASITGLIMVWSGKALGGVVQHIGISVNGIAILLCAFMAVRYAMARKIAIHRRWAVRLFLAVSGVWFFRVGLMFWIAVNQGPAGFDPKTFQGPALEFLAFAQFLLPLAVWEVYLYAQEKGGRVARVAMASGLLVLTLAMALGILVASKGLWLPNM